ncbi:MAG: hypothetical protein KAQ98_10370 [Bacteriovoracaceae bacterium]|nr:hypothetical protein [Bacteriovoracaceae bacterium]
MFKFVPPSTDFFKNELKISSREFEIISSLIFRETGISLGKHKTSMVQSRLSKRLRDLGLSDFEEYLFCLEGKNGYDELPYFINALTTNKTEFFREVSHFNFLKNKYLKDWTRLRAEKNTCYVWSAACSTGEEVYSLAMSLEDFRVEAPFFSYKILGTDIDTSVLKRAREGIYLGENVRIVPPVQKHRYLFSGSGKNRGRYRISNILRANIKFKQFNLVEPVNDLPIRFDVIFLRNVLIYFKKETIGKVIRNLAGRLNRGGLLFIGHSETLNGVNHKLCSLGNSIYRKE